MPKTKENERYIGFCLSTELCNKVIELSKIKSVETGVNHSQSDILRIAVYDLLKKYENADKNQEQN